VVRAGKIVVVGIVVLAIAAAVAAGTSKLYDRVAAASLVPRSELTGIACPGPTACWAVGATGTVVAGDVLGEAVHPLVEQVAATGATPVRVPQLTEADLDLDSVACSSPSRCWAVGSDLAGAVVVEWRRDRGWRPEGDLPVATGGASDVLHAVTCPSSTSCWAFGNRHDTRAYVLHWSRGTGRWRSIGTPLEDSSFTSLGCFGPAACFFGTTRQGIFERVDGSWVSVGGLPIGEGASTVSCASATDCLATFADGAAAYRFDGRSWSATTPISAARRLHLVSCAASGGCWAEAVTGGNRHLLAQQVGDGWRVLPVPASLSALVAGVDCTPSSCVAVGARRRQAPAPPYAWSASLTRLPLRAG